MHCRLCEQTVMAPRELEEGLPAYECGKCGGIWIPAQNYWSWLKAKGNILPEKPDGYTLKTEEFDSRNIKVCAECGHFLTRRKVGRGIGFFVDRCETCGGIWLDKNEWEILKSRNLHDEIHFIFGEPWQRGVASEESRKSHETMAKSRLGEADYAKVSEFRSWMASHHQDSFIRAYLNNLQS